LLGRTALTWPSRPGQGRETTKNSDAPIVVGIDGSPSSYAALNWAVPEANRRHLPLRLVHAVEWHSYEPVPPQRDGVTEIVAQSLERVRTAAPDLHAATRLVDGDAAGALVEESAQASMVVVGHRGLGGFHHLFAGSVSIQTATHAHCPAVVVRPDPSEPTEPQAAGGSIGRIVVGVDGSKLSLAAIDFAFEEAALRGIGLTAVHAWQIPLSESPSVSFAVYERTDLADMERKMLVDSLADHEARHPDVPVRQLLVEGNAAAVLIQESVGAELLVVGSRGHGGFAGLLLGSVSDTAIRHASCSVAVVRP
jgi:nucleotide-binding universal stress UspA family protein